MKLCVSPRSSRQSAPSERSEPTKNLSRSSCAFVSEASAPKLLSTTMIPGIAIGRWNWPPS